MIYMIFITEGFLEVTIESYYRPEWDLNPRPLNSVQEYIYIYYIYIYCIYIMYNIYDLYNLYNIFIYIYIYIYICIYSLSLVQFSSIKYCYQWPFCLF